MCQGSYKISLIKSSATSSDVDGDESSDEYRLETLINSPECSISLKLTAESTDTEFESNVMDYSIFITILCVGHLYACIHMIRSVSSNESSGQSYSLLTLILITAWDIALCFFHLYQAASFDWVTILSIIFR